MSSLFVGNLSSHVRHRELENVFRRFGRSNFELKDGFGFVVYEEHRDAKRALEALQGKSLCGEQPSISWARKRRPFQRYAGKTNFATRDKYQSRRRSSLETDRGSDDAKRDEKFLDEVKDGSRASETKEGAARSAEREAEKLGFDEEIGDIDPLDSGRWDPHMDGSPENMMVDGLLEDEEHALHDKDKANEKGSAQEKSQGSPGDRHFERSSRGYRNSLDQHKRGRDAFTGRPQERCYNCGQSGHVKWQCRLRPKRIGMHTRDGGYDSRRNDSRYFSGRGGFRGIGGGRFRGMNGSRRMLNRDVDTRYAKRSSRRHDVRHYDPVDGKTRDKDRQRRRRSESPKDSSSRGRSKRKHKRSSKKSTHSKKRQRSSSGSPSPSSSRSARTSSSSPSGSRSRSAASRSPSPSSNSGSQSSSSGSQSRSSQSQSSRSHSSSAGSLSRSCSASSQSRKSPTKSGSRSPSSHSRGSRGISSPSPKAKRASYSPRSNSQGRSRSSTYEEDKELQEKQVCEPAIDNGIEERDDWKYSPEGHDTMDQSDAKRRERRRMWSREAKKQKTQSRSDTEEPRSEAELQSNGVKRVSKSIKADEVQLSAPQDGMTANEPFFSDSVSLKSSELPSHSQMADAKCSLYVAIMKEGRKGIGAHDDGQAALATASFGAARLWPWEAILYRRIKRGPISTANYEKRKAQNEEFGIKDTFVRSSSGWWENPGE